MSGRHDCVASRGGARGGRAWAIFIRRGPRVDGAGQAGLTQPLPARQWTIHPLNRSKMAIATH